MTVALPTSRLRAARDDMTVAPSMPTNTQNMMMKQFTICWITSPSGAASGPAVPAATALLYTAPQKSAVKMPALNKKRLNSTKTASDTTLHTMTMAFRNDALSTPRMTKMVSSHITTDAMAMHGTVLPGRNSGKK